MYIHIYIYIYTHIHIHIYTHVCSCVVGTACGDDFLLFFSGTVGPFPFVRIHLPARAVRAVLPS